MKQYPLFTALAIFLLLFLSCFNHSDDPELIIEIFIQGTVKDAATGKPITDAEVTLSFEEKTLQKSKTNGKGAFSFPVSQDGNYQLLVQASGYRNAEKSFPLTNLSNNDVDITMTLANSLTITNESSYDIENVKWSNGNANFGSIKIAGSVEVPVDTGSGYVFFTRSNDGLNVHTEYVDVKQGERRKYIVADTTIVVEVGYGENKKTLGAIKTANPNPSSSSVAVVPSSSSAVVTLPSSGSKPSSSSNAPPSSSSNAPPSSSSSTSNTNDSGHCKEGGKEAYCDWGGGCEAIDTRYLYLTTGDPNSYVCNGLTSNPRPCTCEELIKTCKDYTPSKTVYYNASCTSNTQPSSPSVGCTAANNTKTQYCSNGTLKEYGSMTDGVQTYKTIVIGNQTWMAENLSYNVSGSKCYGDDEANCTIYGKLYNWTTAKSVCPQGWRLPNDADWTTLINFVGTDPGKKLKANSSLWQTNTGTDNYGFSALPGGYGFSNGSLLGVDFDGVGSYGRWWSASEDRSNYAYSRFMDYDNGYAHYYSVDKSNLFSVRCVQN